MSLSQKLIQWYQVNHRDLPWRHSTNPYFIWLSEIILQQTRVDQGMAYYLRFTERFPTVEDLAHAEEQEVLKLWQGLGYYSRARNLHKSAKTIVDDHLGVFPADYNSLLQLKGVGDYTASAIASHAFGLAHAVVDGNVYRFLSRYFGIEQPIDIGKNQKYFKKLAQEILDSKHPGIHNQAIMEFGALQCKPKAPDCTLCPLKDDCQALAYDKVDLLPIKQGKTKIRNRYFNYIVVKDNKGDIIMKKRQAKDVWQNLFDFPLIETNEPVEPIDVLKTASFISLFGEITYSIKKVFPPQIHLLSHQKLHLQFIQLKQENGMLKDPIEKYSSLDLNKLPLPKPIEKFLDQLFNP